MRPPWGRPLHKGYRNELRAKGNSLPRSARGVRGVRRSTPRLNQVTDIGRCRACRAVDQAEPVKRDTERLCDLSERARAPAFPTAAILP